MMNSHRHKSIDVLITHTPPYGIGDYNGTKHIGDRSLLNTIMCMQNPPKIHIFGHCHSGYGVYKYRRDGHNTSDNSDIRDISDIRDSNNIKNEPSTDTGTGTGTSSAKDDIIGNNTVNQPPTQSHIQSHIQSPISSQFPALNGTIFINAASCNQGRVISNSPIVIDIEIP